MLHFPDEVYCADTANSTAESPLYEECLREVENKKIYEKSKRTWVTIVIALAVFFGVFIGEITPASNAPLFQILINEFIFYIGRNSLLFPSTKHQTEEGRNKNGKTETSIGARNGGGAVKRENMID